MSPLPRGFGEDTNVSGPLRANKGPRIFFIPGGTSTTVTLLDDIPVEIVRHQLFLKKDKVAAGMRQTCAGMIAREHPEPCPRICQVCNTALRHKEQIGRRLYCYLTLIDERKYTFKGQEFQDMKQLLELDKKGAELFAEKRKTYGKLAGARFKVYRSKTAQNSPRYGDQWEFLGHVEPLRQFWYSPGIKKIMEAAAKKGERPLTHQQAVASLITPYDYDSEIGVYKKEEAESFVAYLEGEAALGRGQAGSDEDDTPPPPPSSTPDYAAAPPQTMAPSQMPATAPPPPAPHQQAPAAYAPPPPPPAAPDPAGAPPVGQQYQAPPPPWGQQQPAGPPPQQHPGYAPPPPGYGAPPPQHQQPYGAPPPPPPGAPAVGPGFVPNPVPQQAPGFAPPPPPPAAPGTPPPPPPGAAPAGYRPDFNQGWTPQAPAAAAPAPKSSLQDF